MADSLDDVFCNIRLDKDSSLGNNYYQNCINRDHNFSDYVTHGGAGLNTRRSEYEDYSVFIIKSSEISIWIVVAYGIARGPNEMNYFLQARWKLLDRGPKGIDGYFEIRNFKSKI